MKLGIIDLETGNLGSLKSAINKLNIKHRICKKKFDFEGIDRIILPGVGAFGDFMEKLEKSDLKNLLIDKIQKKVPILGICVGFQVLFSESYEHGVNKGLNIIKGQLKNLKDENLNIKVPHVGWNECKLLKDCKLFYGIKNYSDFYFTHSYFVKNFDEKIVISETEYGTKIVSTINQENIYGVQFHPEKSQLNGLQVLKNFNERC